MTDGQAIPGFHCTDCGTCCLEGASRLPLTAADVARWEQAAPHLLDWVEADGKELRTRPLTARSSTRCPWIRKRRNRDSYYCRIYEVRPEVCRRYPTSREHAAFTGCSGYSNSDRNSS